MTFDELFQKCVGESKIRAFVADTGLTERAWQYARRERTRPSLDMWAALVRQRPDLREDINSWFFENVLCI